MLHKWCKLHGTQLSILIFVQVVKQHTGVLYGNIGTEVIYTKPKLIRADLVLAWKVQPLQQLLLIFECKL
jgi:hypothetical protein